jgi:hypothetical protein
MPYGKFSLNPAGKFTFLSHVEELIASYDDENDNYIFTVFQISEGIYDCPFIGEHQRILKCKGDEWYIAYPH